MRVWGAGPHRLCSKVLMGARKSVGTVRRAAGRETLVCSGPLGLYEGLALRGGAANGEGNDGILYLGTA